MNLVKAFLASCITLVVVSACQTTDQTGNAPIYAMQQQAVYGYKEYRLTIKEYQRHNMVFAYNPNTGAYRWAGKFDEHGIPYAVDKTLENCVNCKVFDINGVIVWKNIDPQLKAQLLSPIELSYDKKTRPYDEDDYRISGSQLREYKEYLTINEEFDNSAFFVSDDGRSFGTGFSTGVSGAGYASSIQRALRSCQIASNDTICYLFAADGKPVNEEAEMAVKRD